MEKGALIGQGRTAEVYAWGKDRIVKLFQAGMPAHIVDQEFNITRAADAAGIPVPGIGERIEIDGRFGIIFERLEGPSMLKSLASQPWRMLTIARQLGELHASIHACAALPELPSQHEQIERSIRAAKDLPDAITEASLACLAQLPEGDSLCHGDFHPDNIIMTSHGPVIIDWMTGTRGNPMADVCRTKLLFLTSGLPLGSPVHLRVLANTLRVLIEKVYRTRYLQVHSGSEELISAWQLPLMTARLREVESFPKEKQLLLARINALIQ